MIDVGKWREKGYRETIFPKIRKPDKEVKMCIACNREPISGTSKYGLECKVYKIQHRGKLPPWVDKVLLKGVRG